MDWSSSFVVVYFKGSFVTSSGEIRYFSDSTRWAYDEDHVDIVLLCVLFYYYYYLLFNTVYVWLQNMRENQNMNTLNNPSNNKICLVFTVFLHQFVHLTLVVLVLIIVNTIYQNIK